MKEEAAPEPQVEASGFREYIMKHSINAYIVLIKP